MRSLKLSLFLSTLIFGSLCLFAPAVSQAQLKSKILGYRVENVKVGDRFIYSITETRPGRKKAITKRSTMTERVISLDAGYEDKFGARKLIRDSVTGESVYYLETPGISFSINEPSALTPLRPAGQWRTYPLHIAKGKSIKLPESEQVIDLGSSKSTTKSTASLSILGTEKLRVGKQTYPCVKIRETVAHVSSIEPLADTSTKRMSDHPRKTKTHKETRVSTFWYSPGLQTLVKYTTSQGKQSFTQTLTKYMRAPAQTAMLQKTATGVHERVRRSN